MSKTRDVISDKDRSKMLKLYADGHSPKVIAEWFGRSISSVYKLVAGHIPKSQRRPAERDWRAAP